MTEPVSIAWLDSVSKEQLVSITQELGIEHTGTTREIRKRIAAWAAKALIDPELHAKFLAMEAAYNEQEAHWRNESEPKTPLTVNQGERTANVPVRPPTQSQFAYPPPSLQPPTTSIAPNADVLNNGNHVPTVTFAPIIDQVRKWSVKYDGGRDPLAFAERLEELADVYALNVDLLPKTMPELLSGTALQWYRNNNEHWSTWHSFKRDFLNFFLPAQYFERLEDDIRQRRQRPREKFKDYVIAIQNLMRRAAYSNEQRLERIFRNSHADYLLYIKRRDFNTLPELLALAEEYEGIQESRRRAPEVSRHEVARHVGDDTIMSPSPPRQAFQRRPPPRREQHHREASYNNAARTPPPSRATIQTDHSGNTCRRCGQEGHYARRCRNPQKLFCWECGRADIRTIECCRRRPGKRQRASAEDRRDEAPEYSAGQPIILSQERGRLYALISLGGAPAEAVIDTGASRSFVSASVAEQLVSLGRGKKITVAIGILMADGTRNQISDAVRTVIRLGQTIHNAVLYVMPGAIDDIILGLDTLGGMGATVSCGGHRVVLTEPPIQPTSATPSEPTPSTENPEPPAMTNHSPPRSRKGRRLTRRRSARENINRVEHEDLNHEDEAARIRDFLAEELQKFENISGVATVGEHRIIMTDERPIKQRYFPRNPAMQSVIDTEIDELLKKGCIEPSRSPHSAPIVLARKKNGKWRLCVDYRQLNARSVPDAYPLPRIQHILDKLRQAKYISSLDLKNGYWQIPLEPKSRPYTAFTVPGRGLFQWRVMPFGLHSAPATFQRALDQVIGPEMEPYAFAYLDDIIVIGSTFDEHVEHLREVLRRLQRANLCINPEKCDFFKRELRYLGHVISDKGIHTDPDKVAAIKELKPPTNVKE
ncbi:uncharacterized protein LOC118756716, partial [Rhagoletis pomonella]|uniref:uncharacterized protein LOC118756716 n=1 Tax=Rhagoletis pomonella TaxID=28610 RepID=UPI001783DCC0